MSDCILTDEEWRLILKRIREGECVPFLGAGASLGHGQEKGLPTGSALSMALAAECDYPGDEKEKEDLLKVAQYYAFWQDPHAMYKSVIKKLTTSNVKPGLIHHTFAELPLTGVMTTNFDDLMERAFVEVGKQPRAVVYRRHADIAEVELGTVESPLVYKLHGSLEDEASLIVMEDDVIDFVACLLLGDPPLPKSIKAMFRENSILFIGYGLRDWNIRALMRALRGERRFGAPSIASFAIQKRPRNGHLAEQWEKGIMYWRTTENLRCYDIDALEFAKELKRRYDLGEGK